VSRDTPWSEAIVAGGILNTAGYFLGSLLVIGFPAMVIGAGFFVAGVVTSRRTTWLLRDFLALLVFSSVSVSILLNVQEILLGPSAAFGPHGLFVRLAVVIGALLAGLGSVTALRRTELVPQFG
jgi:hypothetical protein